MKRLRLRYAPDFPAPLKRSVGPIIRRLAPYFCDVVDSIHVSFADDEEAEARIDVRERYRHGNVMIGAEFMKMSEDEREETIAHELAHITSDPMIRAAEHIIDEMKDPSARNMAARVFTDANETVTTNIARAVLRAIRA